MNSAKAIPLKDVQSALMCAVVRLKAAHPGGERHGRTAAFTQAPTWLPNCRDSLRARRLGMEHSRVMKQHFTPMHAGDMDRLLERVRLEHGLQEVRRTWGAGFRALQKEFSLTVMR